MNQNSHRHSVSRVVLPSGRAIAVVRFHQEPKRASTELHVCPECSCELVQPVAWVEASGDCWEITLSCPNCRWRNVGTYSDDQVEIFEEKLDDGLDDDAPRPAATRAGQHGRRGGSLRRRAAVRLHPPRGLLGRSLTSSVLRVALDHAIGDQHQGLALGRGQARQPLLGADHELQRPGASPIERAGGRDLLAHAPRLARVSSRSGDRARPARRRARGRSAAAA